LDLSAAAPRRQTLVITDGCTVCDVTSQVFTLPREAETEQCSAAVEDDKSSLSLQILLCANDTVYRRQKKLHNFVSF